MNNDNRKNQNDGNGRYDGNGKYDANRDPLSGEPGSHAVGTGVGAVLGGAAAGAVTGTVAGPIGTAVGAAIGAVVGGLAGKGVAEAIDPTSERAYWSENFSGRDYVESGSTFKDYGPAYGLGVDSRSRNPGRDFDDVESEMSSEWASNRGNSTLNWDRARPAARDAWNRINPAS